MVLLYSSLFKKSRDVIDVLLFLESFQCEEEKNDTNQEEEEDEHFSR